MARKPRHVRLNRIDVVKYKIIGLIEESQRRVSFLSHFALLLSKIYKFRNYQFISSYIGYYTSFVFIFINYVFYLHQMSHDVFASPSLISNSVRLDSKVHLNNLRFVIDKFENLQSYKVFYANFKDVCKLKEIRVLNKNISKVVDQLKTYDQMKDKYGEELLGRLLIDLHPNQSNFTIEMDNYQLSMDYFHDFPFVDSYYNLFRFRFGIVQTHFLDIQNCIIQAMLKEYALDQAILFRVSDLNGLINLKLSFFYYLPLIISIGWLPNCLSIAGEKLKERNTNIKRFYKICGLDMLTYHFSYTFYIFLSLLFQTILFILILHIINLPQHYEVVSKPNGDVFFHHRIIDTYHFFQVMVCYNLATALHVQLFSLLYTTKKHFYISFTFYTFFTTLLPFSILITHLRVPYETYADQVEQILNTKFFIIFAVFLLFPNAALTYALRQIEDMSHIDNYPKATRGSVYNLRTFESLSFCHITFADIMYILITYCTLCMIFILNYELGYKSICKLLCLDLLNVKLQRFYKMMIKNSDRQVLLRMVNYCSRQKNCNCSINNETHTKCVNELIDLNIQAKCNEIIVILCNKHKSKEYFFKSVLGEVSIRSGELFLDKYRLNSFTKPLFINSFPTSSTGVCFEEDIFDNPLSLEENLEFYSKLKSSQFSANFSDIVLLEHLLKLKDVKRVPVDLMNKNIKRKLAVAIALLGSTQRILLLNEPTQGTDLETTKLIFETLVKLKHDKLIIVLTTNPRLNFHTYADHLYVLNNCELFHIGTLHQLMNSTHSGIHLMFKILNRNFKIEQIDEILNEYFGEKEFALVSRDENRLIWYSYNINLIDICTDFKTAINKISNELNVRLEKIKVCRMKLNLSAKNQRPEPLPFEQNPNIFYIGAPSRVPLKRANSLSPPPSGPVETGRFTGFMYCIRAKIFAVESFLIDLATLVFIFMVCLYFLNTYEFLNIIPWFDKQNFPFKSKSNITKSGINHNAIGSEKLKALDYSSSAIMDNLMIYMIETHRDQYSLKQPKLEFKTKDLISYINRHLSEDLNTHEFLCIQISDSFKYVHQEKIDSILIEKHVGGIMKLDYRKELDGITVNLIHNSHFPYLLLQILNLFTNFIIEHSDKYNSTAHLPGATRLPFKTNLQFNEMKGLRYLYKNLSNRIINFFLAACIFFLLSIFLNIQQNKLMKNVTAATYWTSNLILDYLIGLLTCSALLLAVLVIKRVYGVHFFDFSIVFYILYFLVLTASLVFLFYIIYLCTSSLKNYLVFVAELCFVFGFAIPLLFSNTQYYLEAYYESHRASYSYFNVVVYLISFLSPIFNFIWTIDKIQFYHWDLKLCEELKSNFVDHFCKGRNMTTYNYVLNLPLCQDRIFKCCSSRELIYNHYLNDIFITSFPLLVLNCLFSGVFLIATDGLDTMSLLVRLKH